jgi:molybdenum cofactor cytidylyltransferase
VVVLGHAADRVREAIADLPVRIVTNEQWESGQAGSIQAGLSALPPGTGACIFCPVDMPHISSVYLHALKQEHARSGAAIIAPLVEGQRANPVLFDSETFPAFADLRGEQGGRSLFSRYKLHYLPWHDPSLMLDVDTPADYARLKELE